MKRVLLFMLMAASVVSYAQKKQKPNVNKALKMMQEGNLAEAKAMIDDATTYEKTKDDGKTWYYRGLIYATIDTASNEAISSLADNAFAVAMESFKKADEIDKSGSKYFVQDPNSIVPVTKDQQVEMLANYYLDKGIKRFQDEQDYQGSLTSLQKTMAISDSQMKAYANDTLAYYVAAIVAQQADSLDLAISSARTYIDKGGNSKDAYIILYQIYNEGPKEDKEKALAVLREAKKALPNNPDFPKLEIGMLIDMERIDEARQELEQAVKKETDNKTLQFYLAYTYDKMGNVEAARKAYQEALRIDPAYYEAQFYLANTYLVPVDKVVKELNALSNTSKDAKRRQELLQERVKVSEAAIPHWEKTEKMKAPDTDSQIETLQKLSLLYYYTADDKNSERVAKQLKALGVED